MDKPRPMTIVCRKADSEDLILVRVFALEVDEAFAICTKLGYRPRNLG